MPAVCKDNAGAKLPASSVSQPCHVTWDYRRITGPAWEETPSETYAIVHTKGTLALLASLNWFYWAWKFPYFGDMKQPVEHKHQQLP